MAENSLVVAFFLLPLILGVALALFFKKLRLHAGTNLRWLRLLCGNALVLCFVLSILMLAGEIYYRFIYDTTDSFGLTKNHTRWLNKHFAINEDGFRDSVSPYAVNIPSGLRRITFCGDSFTAGHGVANVEDRFGNLIRETHPDWDVHIIALNGLDSGPQLLIFKNLLEREYEVDIVVLVYVLNDIADIVPEWQATIKRIYGGPDPGFLVQNSYLFNTMYFRYIAYNDPDIANYYDFVRDNYKGPVWEQQQARLKEYRDEITTHGGQLLVVTFPFMHSLGADNQYLPIHEKLDRFWKDLQVPHLDLTKAFESHSSSSLVVNKFDAHPNEKAHRIAAKAIDEFIKQQMKSAVEIGN